MKPKPRKTDLHDAPKHLREVEAEMWRAIVGEHRFDDTASLALLRTALESHQRARMCREAVDKDGLTARDRFGNIRPHPLLAAERDARAAFLQAMRSLNLDILE